MTDQLNSRLEEVNKAFSRQSINYDLYEDRNSSLKWMRNQVRKLALEYLKPGDKILELNSGTGLDAEFFAQNGFDIHCTDLSDGMIRQMQNKFSEKKFSGNITVQQCSFTELDKISVKKFDLIFSNFGGLNCIPDLKEAAKFFPSLLNQNGKVFLVVLPPVCPWEIIQIFRFKFSFAFRRLNKYGTTANIEGIKFQTYYFSAKKVIKALGREFKLLRLKSLGFFTPTPQMEKIPQKFPGLTKVLNKIDEAISGIFPFNRMGDHIIVTAQFHERK